MPNFATPYLLLLGSGTIVSLPNYDGTASQSLTTNGSGLLAFSTRLGNVSEDASPQFLANLDMQRNDIHSVGQIGIDGGVLGPALTSPSAPLHVAGPDGVGTLPSLGSSLSSVFENNFSINDAFFISTDESILNFGNYTNPRDGMISYSADGTRTMKFSVSNQETLVMTSGAVGIGTSSPTALLDISGSLAYDAIHFGSTDRGIGFSSTADMIFWANSADKIQFGHSSRTGGKIATIDLANSRMGIGEISPDSTLHLYENNTNTGSSVGLKIEQDGNGDASIAFVLTGSNSYIAGIDNSDGNKFKISPTNFGTAALIMDSAGYLGLGGVTDPSASLHVQGFDGTGTTPSLSSFTTAVLQNNNDTSNECTLSIIAGTAGSSNIFFGDADSQSAGQINYLHNTDEMDFYCGTGRVLKLDRTGTDVNYLEIESSATGKGPFVKPEGSDLSIPLNLATKSTNAIVCQDDIILPNLGSPNVSGGYSEAESATTWYGRLFYYTTNNRVTTSSPDGEKALHTMSPLSWHAGQMKPDSTSPFGWTERNQHTVAAFNDSSDEIGYLTGVMPRDYQGDGITVVIVWTAETATSGNAKWNAAFERIASAGTDIDSDSFASDNTATTAAQGTSGVASSTSITFTDGSDMDSVGAGESFRLKITRDADDAGDTMSGDAQIVSVSIYGTNDII